MTGAWLKRFIDGTPRFLAVSESNHDVAVKEVQRSVRECEVHKQAANIRALRAATKAIYER